MSRADSLSREDAVREIESLRDRVRTLEALVEALQTQNTQLKRVLAGSSGGFSQLNPDNMVSILDRLDHVEETVLEHDDQFEMFVVENGKHATPDERAMHLRHVMVNRAGSDDGDDLVIMNRDTADYVLDGSLHKGTVLDAMRRAANGSDANIDGASDLQPVDAITFYRGGTVGSDGSPDQSRLELDPANLTAAEARQNLTTGEAEGGG